MTATRGDPRRATGALGEDLAVRALEAAGMVVLARNWRCRWGELDIVAVEPGAGGEETLVFCEVKTRRGLGYGSPAEAITYVKLRRLRRLAAEWIAAEGRHASGIRIDVVGIVLGPGPGSASEVTHLRGVA